MLLSERRERLEKKLSEAGFKIRYRKRDELILHKCPLHNDKTPSLTINTEKGYFRCFSCNDHGSISKLLSYYGIKYGNYYEVPTVDELEQLLDLDLGGIDGEISAQNNEPEYKADINELKNYRYYHPYLESRGFSKEFILKNKIGFDKQSLRVTIPIFLFGDFFGCIRRSVCGDVPKVVYDNGMPKERIIYCPLTNTGQGDIITVCEGFADSLKSSFYGIDSCSILGCLISEKQIELVYEFANGRDIIWAMDNDDPGREGLNRIIRMIPGIDNSRIFEYCDDIKDIGDSSEQQFRYGIDNARMVIDY